MKIKTISILGCGWFGMPLAKKLVQYGYRVKGSTTRMEKLRALETIGMEAFLINFEDGEKRYDPKFFETDVLIISIPPKSKSPNLKDYPDKINTIALAASKANIQQVILISSTGVYADGNFVVDEHQVPNPENDSGKMMHVAEELLKEYSRFTTTIIRFAGLIGPERNLAKHFAGKTAIANGLAPINLIHLDDCLKLTQTIIEQKAFGKIYHGVCPDHPTRAEFYTKNCMVNHLPLPQFDNELLAWKQIESVNVPTILGYSYEINNWDDWLKQRA